MELFKLLGTIAIDNSEANKALKDTSSAAKNTANDVEDSADTADRASSRWGSAFSKIGSAAVAVGKTVATDVHVLGNIHDDYNREFMEAAETIKRYGFKVYAYNLEGQLLQVYENSKAAAEATGVELTIVNNYSKKETPYWHKGVLFLRKPIEEVLKEKPDLLKIKKDILPKTVYVYKYSTKEFLGQFQKVAEAEKALNLPDNTISNYVRKEMPMYKRDLLFLYHYINWLEDEKNLL